MRVPSGISDPLKPSGSGVLHDVVDAWVHPPEPRWPAIVALLSVAGLDLALPSSLTVSHHLGPRWLVLALVGVLLIPTIITFRMRHHTLNKFFGFLVLGVVTLTEVYSLTLLVMVLPTKELEPDQLLRSALALWISNILIFALWYWRLDAGGPHKRDLRLFHDRGAFLFPQMSLDDEQRSALGLASWRPQFIDYLFVAFNHSTAFSPTDTAILSRWAKVLVMIQSGISLATIALLAARAVNILGS